MLRLLSLLLVLPVISHAEPVQNIVEEHILPGFGTLERNAADLDAVAAVDCAPNSEQLRKAYHATFDAWIGVSHLRFGPTEADHRAFALAFWPDSKGATGRALAQLIADEDQVIDDPESFAQVSVAARGLYALEQLLYGDYVGETPYHCTLIRAISHDISRVSTAMANDWRVNYAALLLTPGAEGNQRYFSYDEAMRELFTSLASGVEFTADVRLGRPLGTFERPRPTRADAWRAGRSLRNVALSLHATKSMALMLSETAPPEITNRLTQAFDRAIELAERLEDPDFAGVAVQQERIRVEALQSAIKGIQTIITTELGPAIGVAGGFNSLDGD